MSELNITPATMTNDELDWALFEHFKPKDVRVENDGGMIGGLYTWHGLKATQWSPSQFWDDCAPLIEAACKEHGLEFRLFFYGQDANPQWQGQFESDTSSEFARIGPGCDSAPEAAARALVGLIQRKETP